MSDLPRSRALRAGNLLVAVVLLLMALLQGAVLVDYVQHRGDLPFGTELGLMYRSPAHYVAGTLVLLLLPLGGLGLSFRRSTPRKVLGVRLAALLLTAAMTWLTAARA